MTFKRKLILGTVAVAAVAGAGGAIAATQLGNPRQESQAVINDAAQQLGVQPNALSDALKQALVKRVDAAVAAGRLTNEEGNAIKERIQSGELPLFFGGGPPHGQFGGFHGLDAAASYLGMSETELRSQLEGGKSLADVAKAQDKSVDGLIQALVNDAKKHLDEAVSQGRLSADDEKQILSDIKQRITSFVNGDFPRGFGPHGPGFGPGGPPGAGFGPGADGFSGGTPPALPGTSDA
jgi:polyhydroxyalkanoate synthesis regulator phasin